jgi:hypothetical protein
MPQCLHHIGFSTQCAIVLFLFFLAASHCGYLKNTSKESGSKGLGFGLPPKGEAQGTGHKAKTIKENLSSPYALCHTFWAGKAIEL